jgi:hypothetical protein
MKDSVCPKSVRGRHKWPAATAYDLEGRPFKACELCGKRRRVKP